MSDIDAAQLPATIDRLPLLIDRARTRLAEARSSAEVLESHRLAGAALHYAKVTGAANEAHADCLRIITRAEIRMAREIDAAQERGEVACRGDNPNVRPSDNQTVIADLGIDRRRAAEWREFAYAGDQAVDDAIETAMRAAKANGRTVTKNAVRETLRTKRDCSIMTEIAQRPGHLVRLSLWLRNGPEIIRQFADYREALSLASRFAVHVDPGVVREITEFMAELDAALNADRAA